jgi:hypothetical protein
VFSWFKSEAEREYTIGWGVVPALIGNSVVVPITIAFGLAILTVELKKNTGEWVARTVDHETVIAEQVDADIHNGLNVGVTVISGETADWARDVVHVKGVAYGTDGNGTSGAERDSSGRNTIDHIIRAGSENDIVTDVDGSSGSGSIKESVSSAVNGNSCGTTSSNGLGSVVGGWRWNSENTRRISADGTMNKVDGCVVKSSIGRNTLGVSKEALAVSQVTTAHNPDKSLGWVVEVEAVFAVAASDFFFTSELNLFNEIFMANLGETATFLGVKVDIFDQKSGVRKSLFGKAASSVVNTAVESCEFNVDADFVVLKGNQWKSKTSVTVEPELKWNEQSSRWLGGGTTAGTFKFGEFGVISNHASETAFEVTSAASKFVPNIKPGTVLFIDSCTTDGNFNAADKSVTDTADPCSLLAFTNFESWEFDTKVHVSYEITVTSDFDGYLATEVSSTVERLLDNFAGEVSVATVDNFEESDLRVAGKIYILGTVGD